MPGDEVLALLDEGGRVIEWRHPAEKLFGWSAEKALGRPVTAVMREVAADHERRPGGFSDLAVLVKPVLRGTSVVWQVLTTGGSGSGHGMAILKAFLARPPVGLLVLDDQLRVLRTAVASRTPRDTATRGLLGKHFTEVYQLEYPEEATAVAQRVLETGEPVVNRLVRTAGTPGRAGRGCYSISCLRLEDSRGDVLGLVASATDVTGQENAQQRLALLDTVRAHIGQRLNVGAVCRQLVEAVVPVFASMAAVDVIEDVVNGEEPPPVPADPGVLLRRAAFLGRISAYSAGAVYPLAPDTPFSRVLSDLRPCLVVIEDDSPWLAADPARAEAIRRSDARSLIVAPLTCRGRALGMVSFYRLRQEDPFDEDDVAAASAMCAHVALSMDDARQYMREWIIAATVQRKLLPHHPAAQATVEIAPLHLADPQGGGAWIDVIPLPGARTALMIGDVAGQGIATAIAMGLLRTAVRTLAALDLQPDEMLARLSDTAGDLGAMWATMPPLDPLHRGPLTAGCAIAIYDPVDLTCTFARAGFPEPLIVLPDGTSTNLPVPPGPALAAADNAPFPATTVSLPAGSTLAMGTAALAEQILTPTGSLRPLLDGGAGTGPLPQLRDTIAHALSGDHRTTEDLLLLARTQALPPDRVLTRDLPMDPEAAPIARAATRRWLNTWAVDEETVSTTELIVSELVGNAVRYGAPPLRLRLILEKMLTTEVSDSVPGGPHVKHARTIDETGRGLFIVASLAERWGTRYHSQGKTVWAEQAIGAP